MSKAAAIPYLSLRYVREGRIGADGQLPSGWSGESLSITQISRVDCTDAGPALTVHFEFGPSQGSEFVSIIAGSFVQGAPADVYLLSAEVEFTNGENIAAGFATIREWQQNGPCISQLVRKFSLAPQPSRALAAFQIHDPKHLLQPVFSFKRDTTKGGRGRLTLRKMFFLNIYEYSERLFT